MGKKLPPGSIHIGFRYAHGNALPFHLKGIDRRQHLYLIGKTGTGKSTLLRNLIIQDILAGRGVALIDPHGDLAESVLDLIPSSRSEDVVYFNPSDEAYPVGLNVLECNTLGQEHLIPSNVVSIFKNIWPEFWGPRLEHTLTAACASLVAAGGQTILGVNRILTDVSFREKVLRRVHDPFLISFWRNEFDTYSARFASEAIAPILNKIGKLVMSPLLRNILGQPQSGFDAGFMMNRKKIFIANLSKGLLGEEKSNLLGSILVSKFQLAAMARASIPESEREDFHLYVDEFQNFTTGSFATILEEARKYRLCLTLAHQHMGQLSERIRTAVLGNAGSIITFRIGHTDAEIIAKEFSDEYPINRFTELANHTVYAKLLVDGEATQSFRGWTVPSPPASRSRRDKIERRSRERFGLPRYKVEEKLKRWIQPSQKHLIRRTFRRKLSE